MYALRTTCLLLLAWLSYQLPSVAQPNAKKSGQQSESQKPESSQKGTAGKSQIAESQKQGNATQPDDIPEKRLYHKYMRATIWGVVINLLILIGFGIQTVHTMKAVKAAGDQSKAMERHIEEAERSANAMEKIATVIDSGNVAIMRAYISVVIGAANYQDRQEGIKFEGKPLLVNTGSTPARNVRIWIGAKIIAHAQAETFDYPLPNEVAKAPGVCAPHQNYGLSAIVADSIPDVEVPDIKHGRTGALTVWGVVTYDDIFGEHHTTRFGQWLFWYPNQTVYGYYIPGQNDMS